MELLQTLPTVMTFQILDCPYDTAIKIPWNAAELLDWVLRLRTNKKRQNFLKKSNLHIPYHLFRRFLLTLPHINIILQENYNALEFCTSLWKKFFDMLLEMIINNWIFMYLSRKRLFHLCQSRIFCYCAIKTFFWVNCV